MTENDTSNAEPSSRSFWSKYRTAIIFGAVAAWVATISVGKLGRDRAASTTKGATELLEIGALPVT